MGRSISPITGRMLSPILRRELENLDKDADSRKSAMKALKSYVKDLDSKAIPVFLAHVSETKQTGISTGEHTISLYEVLARVHGPKLVPQIENIMSTIVKTLSTSAGSFALHQACSKVVPSIARYAIDPTTAEDRKRHIIHSLCKPLSECLLSSQENLSSGAALCLQALVEFDNWRFASNEMVNDVCQKVAGALEKHSQTNSHMALVTALAKHNSLIVEAYARLLIHSGLYILDAGFMESNSQKQLSAIHMVSSLMRFLDPRSFMSELELVITEMEKCQHDRMPFVTGAAFEVLQIAKRMCSEKYSKFGRCEKMETRNSTDSSGHQSPESQTVESCLVSDYYTESPNSLNQNADNSRKSVNRRLWNRCENGILDVSLKDGIFSDITRKVDFTSLDSDDSSRNADNFESFAGFVEGTTTNVVTRSNTPSPHRSRPCISIDDVKIFSTPRKLIHSLQDADDYDTDFCENDYKSPMHQEIKWFTSGGPSESVSSTEGVFSNNAEIVPANKSQLKNSTRRIVCVFLVSVVVAFLVLLGIGDQDDAHFIVPT